MVRVFGFTEDLVEYEDFFMDRYEITNKEYQEFVSVGGYDTEKYWTHEFIRDGRRLLQNEAVREFVDRTGRPGPATWRGGTYPDGQSDYPVGGVSWYEAAAFANFRGKTLPTVTHHTAARRHYNNNSWLIAPRSNLGTSGPLPIGTNRAMTALGIYDLVGNVREWNSNDAGLGQRATTGASWADPPYNATSIIPKSPWNRDPSNGIRLVKVFDSAEKIAKLAGPAQPLDRRDFRNLIPASDNEVEIFKRRYAYDPAPLKDEIEDVQEFEHWTRQQIAFDLPYGERGGAFLFLPKSAAPPFETVVYWPGTGALWWRSIDEAYYPAFSFIIRSGRAVAIPLFKGTYHRDDADFSITDETLWPTPESASTKKYSDYQVKHIIDFSRTIDYIKTRNDLRTEKIGYFGFSWGGEEAFIALVVDGRLDAAVLNVGGVDGSYLYRPENDPFNYVKHVRTPTLMINGEFDTAFPVDTSQKPIFELLGTEPRDKKMIITPAAHFVPQDVLIKETLDWFDKYLRVSIHMAE
jgi:dienelactone hydrolase